MALKRNYSHETLTPSHHLKSESKPLCLLLNLNLEGGGGIFNVSFFLAVKLLKSLASGLWDAESGKDTDEHEESEDLHDMVQPRGSITASGTRLHTTNTERGNSSLGNNGADLARSGRNTVGGGTITGREALSGNDERGGIGTEVVEELNENIDGE
jgi:hypothetical protein